MKLPSTSAGELNKSFVALAGVFGGSLFSAFFMLWYSRVYICEIVRALNRGIIGPCSFMIRAVSPEKGIQGLRVQEDRFLASTIQEGDPVKMSLHYKGGFICRHCFMDFFLCSSTGDFHEKEPNMGSCLKGNTVQRAPEPAKDR